MPKGNPTPWLRPSRNTYYVNLGGEQVNLKTADKDEAYQRWHELMVEPVNGGPIDGIEARDVFADFLDWCSKHCALKTYRWHRNYLRRFARTLPAGLRAMDVRPFHVTRWVDRQPRWGDNIRRSAVTSIKRALQWGVTEGYLPYSPLGGMRKPPGRRRETILTAEQRTLILQSIRDSQFKDVVVVMQETGVRPPEIRHVEARHVDLERGLWIFPPSEHKTGRKTGKPRVVYLTPASLEITRRLVNEHPQGPIFRNTHGTPWGKDVIRDRFQRLREKFAGKLPPDLCAYNFRHRRFISLLNKALYKYTARLRSAVTS